MQRYLHYASGHASYKIKGRSMMNLIILIVFVSTAVLFARMEMTPSMDANGNAYGYRRHGNPIANHQTYEQTWGQRNQTYLGMQRPQGEESQPSQPMTGLPASPTAAEETLP